MAQVALSLGSNIDAANHLRTAVAELRQRFGEICLSPVYESEAVGFSGDNFLNVVAVVSTQDSIAELHDWLKALEDAHGRNRNAPKFSGRTLDIDILTYDDFIGDQGGVCLPRDEITKNAFVLLPLADVMADCPHPVTGKTYAQLWNEYDKGRQSIWLADLKFD